MNGLTKVLRNLPLVLGLLALWEGVKDSLAGALSSVKVGEQTTVDVPIVNNATLIKGPEGSRWRVRGVLLEREN